MCVCALLIKLGQLHTYYHVIDVVWCACMWGKIRSDCQSVSKTVLNSYMYISVDEYFGFHLSKLFTWSALQQILATKSLQIITWNQYSI